MTTSADGRRGGAPETPLALRVLDAMPAVVVLVGTSASGKTTLRRLLVEAGLPEDHVVSLDDLRREARTTGERRGRPARALQEYSALAVRKASRRYDALATFGAGYVADATHLLRRDRRSHLSVAVDTELTAIAVLTPVVALDELLRRNDERTPDEHVPEEALFRQHHRRSLLSRAMLLEEGFAEVHELST